MASIKYISAVKRLHHRITVGRYYKAVPIEVILSEKLLRELFPELQEKNVEIGMRYIDRTCTRAPQSTKYLHAVCNDAGEISIFDLRIPERWKIGKSYPVDCMSADANETTFVETTQVGYNELEKQAAVHLDKAACNDVGEVSILDLRIPGQVKISASYPIKTITARVASPTFAETTHVDYNELEKQAAVRLDKTVTDQTSVNAAMLERDAAAFIPAPTQPKAKTSPKREWTEADNLVLEPKSHFIPFYPYS